MHDITSDQHAPLAGRAYLITGAGHGIGRATARKLLSLGATVGVNDLREAFVDEARAALEGAGGRFVAVVADVATRDGMRGAIERLVAEAGRLDGLVNNAAWVRYQPLPEIASDTVDRMLAIGFKSVIWGIQSAAEHMAGPGSIVNVASMAGIRSAANAMVYSGVKAGVMGITRAAAVDLGSRGIRVNAIAPSAVPTEGTAKHRSAERDAIRVSRTPLGRLGTVDDMADTIAYLLGDESRFITGQVLAVDGGTGILIQ
jgi:NAD(P)-dependent dehydrogenase (short-subunit alcohol dehydrogenase family)